MSSDRHNAWRNGAVHIQGQRCGTCIFRADSVIDRGRVAGMIAEADAAGSAIICHATLLTDEHAVCAGYAARRSSVAVRAAYALGVVRHV